VDLDDGILILVRLRLRNLDLRTGALLDFLDFSTTTADDVSANGGRDRDVDGLLQTVSVAAVVL
jgi:hypothetical protein